MTWKTIKRPCRCKRAILGLATMAGFWAAIGLVVAKLAHG